MDKDLVAKRRLPGQPESGERPSSTLTERDFTNVKKLRIAAQKFPCFTKLKPPNAQIMVSNIINLYYYQIFDIIQEMSNKQSQEIVQQQSKDKIIVKASCRKKNKKKDSKVICYSIQKIILILLKTSGE